VEITTGRALRDQALDADLGRADLVESTIDDLRRNTFARVRVAASKPIEVIALVFSAKRASVQDDRVREALSLSLDRNSIQSVFLQRQGEASAALLPNWMTGYGFALPASQDLARARQLRAESGARMVIAIGYTSNDGLARTIAERVVLNARDAGLTAQLATDTAAADAVVERLTLRSADPFAALSQVTAEYELAAEFKGATWQDLFNAERDLLARRVIVPIVHLPRVYGAGPRARNFRVTADGMIDIPYMWVTRPEARNGAGGAR
jgi:ABC-type transport system substrate-binding protein